MTDKSAFRATYSDWRLVKTRGVVQLVFEVPLQDADQAYQVVGGMPNAAEERWFGIARLVSGDVAPEREGADSAPQIEAPSRSSPKSYAQQVAMYCDAPLFRRFCISIMRMPAEETTAEFVRRYCGVETRGKIIAGTEAEKSWIHLRSTYEAWKRVPA